MRIVTELSACLNYEAAEQISRNLAALYKYVLRLLIEANTKQIEGPLIEAEGLLSALREAWKACAPVPPERELITSDLPLQYQPASEYSALAG